MFEFSRCLYCITDAVSCNLKDVENINVGAKILRADRDETLFFDFAATRNGETYRYSQRFTIDDDSFDKVTMVGITLPVVFGSEMMKRVSIANIMAVSYVLGIPDSYRKEIMDLAIAYVGGVNTNHGYNYENKKREQFDMRYMRDEKRGDSISIMITALLNENGYFGGW